MPRGSRAESLAELLTELPDDLRVQAFTHASWVEHRSESYERLAFLGDVVLSLAVSTHLYPRFERYGAGLLMDSDRVLASVCEAVIGAAYLAFGLERVAPAVASAFAEEIDEALRHPVDYKSVLQERLARRAEAVSYRIESE